MTVMPRAAPTSAFLDNDSGHYPGLIHGTTVRFEMRGANRPVADFNDLQARFDPHGTEYDLGKREEFSGITVGELVRCLEKLDQDAELVCCGDDNVVVHVSKNNMYVCIDFDTLDDAYEED